MHPRYSDNEDSYFYKTVRLSPEDTWHALSDELDVFLWTPNARSGGVGWSWMLSASGGGTGRSSAATSHTMAGASVESALSSVW
jgi:hypothetical protein